MKTLILYAHPNLSESKFSYSLVKKLDNQLQDITLRVIAQDGNFNIEAEQNELLKYERIIFAFPFWWYNIPWNLKKYIDEVFAFGFGYGMKPEHFKLKNIEFTYLTTVGNTKKSYNPGEFNNFNVTEYLRSLQGTINLCGKDFLKPFIVYGGAVGDLNAEGIDQFVNEIKEDITNEMYNPKIRYAKKGDRKDN